MHVLQPKHTKLKPEEVQKLLLKYNISLSQLPKIRLTDAAVPEGSSVGDVLKIERDNDNGEPSVFYRVIV
jgi:DNA-directed RNA polymerase subunit H